MAKIGDKNKFDFEEHRMRLGEVDANGNCILTPEQKAERSKLHSCPTITMTHPTKGTVQINAHEADSIAAWRKLGYKTPQDLAGPVLDAAAASERAKLKAEVLAEVLQGLELAKKVKA